MALELRSGAQEIVVVAPEAASPEALAPMLAPLRRQLMTARVLALVYEGDHQAKTAQWIELVANKTAQGGEVTAYVCEDRVCQRPTSDPEVFASQLSIARKPDS